MLRCAGPSVACALLAGRVRCPLLDDAALAVYDVESVPPEFLLRLYRLSPRPGVLFARDTVDERGQHRPTVERFATERRAAECPCFGSF